jgi:hypothetical protein
VPRRHNTSPAAMRARQQDAEEQAAGYGPITVTRQGKIDFEEDFLPEGPKPSKPAANVTAKLRDSELPVISAMEYDDMDAAKGLIEEAVMYQEQLAAATEGMKFTKERLAALAQAYGMKNGMRYGQTAIRVQLGQTRKTLDKGLLMLNGCPAEAIEASYKDSKPFDVVTVVDLSGKNGE